MFKFAVAFEVEFKDLEGFDIMWKNMTVLIYIYIYKTEAFEAPTTFHVSTIFKKKT